ncbi:histidyl-tRna synthetase [Cardiosporidium cionae]|uniref:D-aminoacyl-tRNA deacylase n=1 Tax=Cardiosporidium cionae TaxID=476202 RepID=A0ABQ7JD82_9APIC|nr:histidyl-tRna synthetase [Cardiosporidium cionae]|eukprot:KAF8821987.1 histidyl-tRna synthetase [Cardiosporidium cionae]
MRMVIQRVHHASVSMQVDKSEVSSIGAGLMCLVGIAGNDTRADMEYCVRKALKCRLWPEILLVSQFTLFGSLKKGNKPDFHAAMEPKLAHELFEQVIELCKSEYQNEKVKIGSFGNLTSILYENDGPVTLLIDSHEMNLNRKPKQRVKVDNSKM